MHTSEDCADEMEYHHASGVLLALTISQFAIMYTTDSFGQLYKDNPFLHISF
jgi:hypothetical protein